MPLRTQGRWVVDSRGQRVKLSSVNWFGAESPEFVVGGLSRAPLPSIVRWIHEHGFNSIRLPWSNELVATNPVVEAKYLTANPALSGLRALEILDRVVAAAAAEGLMIVLDNHRSQADWCCDYLHGDGLWYSARYPESAWLAHWATMARRYRNQPAVVAAELRNEIRADPAVATALPTWGDGNLATDWKRAAERGGETVLSANPNLLVVIGGTSYQASLREAYGNPARLSVPNRVVYAPHDYSFFHTAAELADYSVFERALDENWGKMLRSDNPDIAPLYLSEFGTCLKGQCVDSQLRYMTLITQYLARTDIDWAYWPLNGTQSSGYSRQHGLLETYGLLDEAWQQGSNDAVLTVLMSVQRPRQGPGIS